MCSIFNEQYSICPICVQYLSVKYRQFIVLGTVLRLKNNYLTFLTTIFQTMVLPCTKHLVQSTMYQIWWYIRSVIQQFMFCGRKNPDTFWSNLNFSSPLKTKSERYWEEWRGILLVITFLQGLAQALGAKLVYKIKMFTKSADEITTGDKQSCCSVGALPCYLSAETCGHRLGFMNYLSSLKGCLLVPETILLPLNTTQC